MIARKQKQEQKSYTDTELIDHLRVMSSPTNMEVAKERVKSKKKKGIELTQCSGKIDAGKALHIFTV